MGGFTKANALRELDIPLAYDIINHDTGGISKADVNHVLRFPTTSQREKFQQQSVLWKGRRAKTAGNTAAWNLWKVCIMRVLGYDDLPADSSRESIISYFRDDDVCRLHVEDAIDGLWGRIAADDGDFVKKSEPSSEE